MSEMRHTVLSPKGWPELLCFGIWRGAFTT